MESIKKRQDEATTKETLKDLEETESSVDADETDTLSPDGAFDEVDEPDQSSDADPV
jgi:hypothetical protein